MEAETAKILTMSDLINRARPLTGSSSISRGRNVVYLSPSELSDQLHMPFNNPTSENPEPKILKPLNLPTVFIGTLSLPPHRQNNYNAKSGAECSCFQFTDGSATICCDILDFHPQLIGKNIRVCAWNFIPFKVGCDFSGFLEIIRWELIDSFSNSIEFSLTLGSSTESKDNSRPKYSLFGVLESISPVSVVPCSIGDSSSGNNLTSLCGFLVKILVCECKLCKSKKTPWALGDLGEENYKNHSFIKSLIVYFCGLASSWHPVIVRLIGNVVTLSGLKKKMVYIEKDDSELMYVTSEKAFFRLLEMAKKCIPSKKVDLRGLAEVGNYAGTVTGVYMQGMVVELDQKVMLLLTDHRLMVPHSVRVGAVVSVRNVHFVSTKFSWAKILILGACSITCICVESFSPLETGCHKKSHSQNLLRRFVDSLAFSARLWVLLTVACFRKKFAGILPEKEILGSKHKIGLAQSYTTSNLPASAFLMLHGVFMEYCRHGLCAYGNKDDYSLLKLVVPISCFKSHFESRWIKMLLDSENDIDIMGSSKQRNYLSCCGRSCAKLIRKSFRSENTGVGLLGNLKVSPSSGRLQLVDATGSIDVVIPDIASTWDFNRVYEVEDFSVVLQGIPDKKYHLELFLSEPFTCRNIFGSAPLESKSKLSLFLYCHFSYRISKYDSSSSGKNCKTSLHEFKGGRFHLLWLNHKFPLLHKCLGDQAVSKRSSALAECIALPWDLIVPEKDEIAHFTGLPLYRLSDVQKFEKHVGKRCKVNEARDAGNSICGHLNNSCCGGFCREKNCCDLDYPLKFPCLISSISFKCPCQGFLHCTDKKAVTSSGCNPDGRRILLEFDSESLYAYQRIRIGAYYIVKHHVNDVICAAKDDNNVTGGAMLVTPETYLWSLSFSSDVVLKNSDSSSVFKFCQSFVRNDDILPDASQQFKIPHLMFSPISPESASDVNICVPADIVSYLKIGTNVSESGLMKSSVSLRKESDVCNGNGVIVTTSLATSGTFHSDLILPEGNLLSLHGRVVAIHDSDGASFVAYPRSDSSNVHQPIFSEGTTTICIHVVVDHHMAMIFGALGKNIYPAGFGPGVDATFHRVLLLGGQNQYMLIPASFIVITSMNVGDYWCIDGSDSVSNSLVQHQTTSSGVFPPALISGITCSMDFKPMQLHCRVVGLCVLVLQKNKKAGYSSTRVQSCSTFLDIPVAGFILDDGSSSCCCWADHERAANILRLPTEASSTQPCMKPSWKFKIPVKGKVHGSSVGHLNRILRRHGRVVIKNYGSMFDSSCLNLSFSVDNNEAICSFDEDILRCLIMNACVNTLWTVVGSVMDSTAMHRLEKQLTELKMTLLPLQNIWATGVCQSDPLTESRLLIQGLLNS